MKEQRSEEVPEPEVEENKEETSENMQVDEIPSEESQEIEVPSEVDVFPDEVDSLEPEHTENFISEENQTIETLETEETDEPVDVQNLQDDSLVETSFAMEERPVNDDVVIDEKDLISWEEASHDLQEVRV
ncbi:hypothetical protein I6H59_03695 [Lactococcus garvieae]|nr:hypothetical protein I6H59_03695 [Lactococcus garvieae]